MLVPTTAVRHGVIHESLPERVRASLEVRDAWRQAGRRQRRGPGVHRLRPGEMAAGVDGAGRLPRRRRRAPPKIADATQQITDASNLDARLRPRPATGEYRRWSTDDTELRRRDPGQLRPGRLLLARRHRQHRPTVGRPDDPVGGRPGQRSLNLGGFDTALPAAGRARSATSSCMPWPSTTSTRTSRALRGRLPLGGRPGLHADHRRRRPSSSTTQPDAGRGSTPTWPARPTGGRAPRSITTCGRGRAGHGRRAVRSGVGDALPVRPLLLQVASRAPAPDGQRDQPVGR